jgi:hypothetical protein
MHTIAQSITNFPDNYALFRYLKWQHSILEVRAASLHALHLNADRRRRRHRQEFNDSVLFICKLHQPYSIQLGVSQQSFTVIYG